jgi:hypothetical protein
MVPRLSAAMAARSMNFMISLLWGSGLGPVLLHRIVSDGGEMGLRLCGIIGRLVI